LFTRTINREYANVKKLSCTFIMRGVPEQGYVFVMPPSCRFPISFHPSGWKEKTASQPIMVCEKAGGSLKFSVVYESTGHYIMVLTVGTSWRRSGGIGRRNGFRDRRAQACGGSNPPFGTIHKNCFLPVRPIFVI
jgi:hypothetical protein